MQEIATRVAKLLSVKSIITLALTAVFVYMAANGEIDKDFLTIYVTVIGFYFGTQAMKSDKEVTTA